jgi:hypothetical protein
LAAIRIHSLAISVRGDKTWDALTDQTALPHKPGLVPGFVREPAEFVTRQAGIWRGAVES